MKIICVTCKYEYDEKAERKCPRCGTPAPVKSGCESCKGCSFWKACIVKQSTGEQNVKQYGRRKVE